jgi:rhamnosyltransferase
MYTTDKIAVLLAAYNGESYIGEQIDSLLRQSYTEWELYIHDDGSRDRTPEIIARMAKRDSRLIPIRQSNSGSISARKAGIRYARDHGIPFLCFCDADDRLPRKSVEKMVSAMFKTDSDLICGDMKCRWHFISVPNSFKSKCLRIGSPVLYSKGEI